MSEDALVNTGAGMAAAWRPGVPVRKMQLKLHQWARADVSRRFDDLYNLVYDPGFLIDAWHRVAGNTGAKTAGIDGLTVAAIESGPGVQPFLMDIRDELKARTYRPAPVRRTQIPKSNGKMRDLGIPTVKDRVVQAALKAVLEPIFEADFLPVSYGFRPGRRAHDAIAEIVYLARRGYSVVLEADIEACFDNIDHVALMDRLRARISDKRVLALVKAFLKAKVMHHGIAKDTPTGTPQGGILSPLPANIALTALDKHFHVQWHTRMGTSWQREKRRKTGTGNWRLVRYADDFVVLVSGPAHRAEALREQVAEVLAPIGLRLSPEKTRVVHIDDGFDFLGHHIRRQRKRGTNKLVVYTRPSKKAIKAVKDRVSERTYRHTQNQSLATLLEGLNRTMTGWATYFRHGTAKRTFNAVDHHAWHRVAIWLRRKHGIPSSQLKGFCDQGWRFADSGTVFLGASSVMIERYRYRGARIPTPWTIEPAANNG
ncbi:group II intron reverse transcriptase/maturase [Streptomyces sp. KMM 9044]|uniref:group II intron reverse transcriptase/maturase n=1 Tax=Streptomyces sp. KMM 9044 TaxID=2744474 RepID=UPI0022B2397D|nr:group II intron reverse transcriptase/maturase [Streptomyces sp. KMM 9044]WAX78762.1 group II intron reverse transcriptase/maturase [Streptomyces sp. KMM 9044]